MAGGVAAATETRPAIEGSRQRVGYLDGWRGISITLVLVGHFGPVPAFGPLGVELFFALSGRLMAEILFVESFPLPKFYVRRVARIFPALLIFAVGCFFLVYRTSLHFKPAAILVALSMSYNYLAAVFGHRIGAFDHLWSLCIEEHAYLLLGAIALGARRWKWRVPAILGTIAVLSMADGAFSSAVLHQDWVADYWRTDAHLGSIFAAATLYLTPGSAGAVRWLRRPWMSPLALGVAAALSLSTVPLSVAYTLGTLCLAVSVCTLDVAAPWVRRLFSARPIVLAGLLSYSIYLWQQPFYKFALGGSPWSAGGLLIAAIGAGALSFYVLESPARRWLNAVGDRVLSSPASPRKTL
jgi:peptidoglycan/LPS O-acetylase OafA/YrhL